MLNIISKVIERIAYNQLPVYREENSFLCDQQFGFRRERSTTDAVRKFTDHVRINFDKSKVTGALFLDLKQAFVTVNHSCLLQKLPYYGILDKEVQWFASYLFHRSQTLFLNGHFSEKEFITHDFLKDLY